MRTRTLVLAVVAASVLLVGATGAVAAQPEEAGNGGDAGPDDDAGPPGELPDQVPDFVSDIHDALRDFLRGVLQGLGETVADLPPGDDERPDAARENSTGDGDTGNATAA